MQKELSMTRIHEALCLAALLIAIAVLAVFEIIPEQVAQLAPLAVVPWIATRNSACTARKA
jgi:CBS domain containing-hemolysin-like protein